MRNKFGSAGADYFAKGVLKEGRGSIQRLLKKSVEYQTEIGT